MSQSRSAVLPRKHHNGAIVLGHSWGTLVGLALALRYPDAVQALVLASGYYYANARADVGHPVTPGYTADRGHFEPNSISSPEQAHVAVAPAQGFSDQAMSPRSSKAF